MTTARHHGIIPQLTLAQRLGIAREYVHMTQADLAEELGLSLATIQRAEGGKSAPARRTILAWAMATGVDLEWIETGETGENPHPDGPDGGESLLSGSNRRNTLYKSAEGPFSVPRFPLPACVAA